MGISHADFVEIQNGKWWRLCLAMRPYGGNYYNLGRETFLVPVIWEEGWPVVAPGSGKVSSVCMHLAMGIRAKMVPSLIVSNISANEKAPHQV